MDFDTLFIYNYFSLLNLMENIELVDVEAQQPINNINRNKEPVRIRDKIKGIISTIAYVIVLALVTFTVLKSILTPETNKVGANTDKYKDAIDLILKVIPTFHNLPAVGMLVGDSTIQDYKKEFENLVSLINIVTPFGNFNNSTNKNDTTTTTPKNLQNN